MIEREELHKQQEERGFSHELNRNNELKLSLLISSLVFSEDMFCQSLVGGWWSLVRCLYVTKWQLLREIKTVKIGWI